LQESLVIKYPDRRASGKGKDKDDVDDRQMRPDRSHPAKTGINPEAAKRGVMDRWKKYGFNTGASI